MNQTLSPLQISEILESVEHLGRVENMDTDAQLAEYILLITQKTNEILA